MRIPIYILGGSDSKPGPVPKDMDHSRMLRGFKGAIEIASGRCLVQEFVDRIRCTNRFEDPVLFGPSHVYGGLVDCPIVDVEGTLADTLTAVRNEMRKKSDLMQPIAITSCDILPSIEEIHELMETCYAPHSNTCFWGQLVTVEADAMGESSWKPAYRFPSEDGSESHTMYPGHLVIVRPAAIRLRLMIHLLQLAYRHRNLRLRSRPVPMILKGIWRLIGEDCRNLARGQWPVLSLAIPWNCFTAFWRFQRKSLSVSRFSKTVARIFLHRDYHRAQSPSVVFSTTGIQSFAKDIDTEDELAELRESLV